MHAVNSRAEQAQAKFSFLLFLLVVSTFHSTLAMTIENFRPVQGTQRIFRCAKTEPLATCGAKDTNELVANDVGLVIDLRSPAERDAAATAVWMERDGFTTTDSSAAAAVDDSPSMPQLEASSEMSRYSLASSVNSSSSSSSSSSSDEGENDTLDSPPKKRVLQIDVQPRDRVLRYLDNNWLTKGQRAWNLAYVVFDTERQHRMRMDALNERGLVGLNEAILETGGYDLCVALMEMTKHLEADTSSVVFHCVQGKDRTGMLAMLCQSIMGMSDEDMIEEYAKSEVMRDASAAAGNIVTVKGSFDRGRFTGAPPEVMRQTLEYVRSRYTSICPGYLDHIKFDQSWRERFIQCQQKTG